MEWRIISVMENSDERVYVSGSLTYTQLKREWPVVHPSDGARKLVEQREEGPSAMWQEVDPATLKLHG